MIRLHDYWRSGACHRVRIALNLKGLAYERVTHDLRAGAQREAGYLALNPQGLVPALEAEGQTITQSLAIMEWLEERHPLPPLLPAGPEARAVVRAIGTMICTDIHPLNNLRVLDTLRRDFAADQDAIDRWIARWVRDGFGAVEALLRQHAGHFACGDAPTMADCCLVPQVYSAERFGVDLGDFPRIRAITARCGEHPAFAAAHPSRQPRP